MLCYLQLEPRACIHCKGADYADYVAELLYIE